MAGYDDIDGADLPMPFGEYLGQPVSSVPPEYLQALLEERGPGISDLSGSEMGKIYRCKIVEPAALIVSRWKADFRHKPKAKPRGRGRTRAKQSGSEPTE